MAKFKGKYLYVRGPDTGSKFRAIIKVLHVGTPRPTLRRITEFDLIWYNEPGRETPFYLPEPSVRITLQRERFRDDEFMNESTLMKFIFAGGLDG